MSSKPLIKKLHDLTKTKFAGDVLWVTVGNVFRTACVFFGWAFLARILGPKGLGVFSFAFAAMNLTASLSELGLGVGIVKFVAAEVNDSDRVRNLLRTGFWMRNVFTLALCLLLVLSAQWISFSVMHNVALHKPLLIAAIGTAASSYFAYILSAYQGVQRFKGYGLLSLFSGSLLLAGFALLNGLDIINPENALLAAAFAFLLPAAMGQFFLKAHLFRWPSKKNWLEARTIMAFSRWVLIGSLFALCIMQMDTFLLTKLSSMEELGRYSASMRLALSVSVFSNSVLTVAMPRVFGKTDHRAMMDIFSKLIRFTPVFVGVFLVVYFLAPFVVITAFGNGYEASIQVFRVLFAAFLLSTITNVMGFLGYGINRPDIITANLFIQLIVLLFAGIEFAATFGALGMAVGVLLSRSAGLVFIFLFLCRAFRRTT